MITRHLPFDRLSDFADGTLEPRDATDVDRHVAECADCAAELARLRSLLVRVASLPRNLEPPAEAWAVLRQRLHPRTRSLVARRRLSWAREWGLRAAAAILLVAGSSAVTVLALRSRQPASIAENAPSSVATQPTTPAAVLVVDQSYAGVVDELTTTLRAQRGALAPETIQTLERTLRIIDEAIAEARAALAADPSNGTLVDVLSANYEQKVQLLRRASELPART